MFWKHSVHTSDDTCNCWQTLSNTVEIYSLWVCQHQCFGRILCAVWTSILWKHSEHTFGATCNCWQIFSNTFNLWVSPENADTVLFRHYNCTVQCNEETIVFCLKCQNIDKASALSIRLHQVSTAEHCGIISCSLLYQHIWSFHYKENPELSDLSTKSGQIFSCLSWSDILH